MLGQRRQCEAALKQAASRPATTVDDIDANVIAVEDAHASLAGLLMTIRDIADELRTLDPERDVELRCLRDKYNTELANMMRTEPTQEERQQYRKMLGLGAAGGSNSPGGQRA
jgi:hypothetical protein